MARLAFTDTHVHFHDMRVPELRYSWLEWGQEEDGVGSIRSERYWADDFLAETRFQNVERVIHVQAALGTEDPVEETRWLQAFTDRLGVPHGIVACADLTSPDLDRTLERHLRFPAVRGIRDYREDVAYIDDPAWEAGFARLGAHRLVCCDAPPVERAARVRELSERHPDTVLCIDHAYLPEKRTEAYFRRWREALTTVAAAPSTVIKISGLAMNDPTWTVDSIRPWVLACIEAFGVERAFFGTNWTVDRLASSYGDVLDAYAQIVADFTPDEQAALFSGNARRIFRV